MSIDLKKTLGSDYRDDLTAEEIVKLLGDNVVNVSDFNIMKNKADKASSEAAGYKKELNATKTSEDLLKQEKEEELQKIIDDNEKLSKKLSIIENEKKFIAMGYDEELANKTAQSLAEGDMQAFFENQKVFNENHEKKIKSEVLKDTKLPSRTDVDKNEFTKEQVSKMSIQDQAKFAEEHPEKYKEYYDKGE